MELKMVILNFRAMCLKGWKDFSIIHTCTCTSTYFIGISLDDFVLCFDDT